jgi:hypothetical protein
LRCGVQYRPELGGCESIVRHDFGHFGHTNISVEKNFSKLAYLLVGISILVPISAQDIIRRQFFILRSAEPGSIASNIPATPFLADWQPKARWQRQSAD